MQDSSTTDPEAAPQENSTPVARSVTRREALGIFGAAGVVMITGCGGGGSSSNAASAGSTTGGSTTTGSSTGTTATGSTTGSTTGMTASATVTPEGEIGPYFADDSATGFNRSNILTNLDGTNKQTGVPLALKIYIRDSEAGFAAMQGAQVDIWHCNALGVYSDEANQGTSDQTWLRGYQISDAAGLVTFTTIIPGWYQGRTTHIHLRVRSKYNSASSTSDGSNTTQLFFSQTIDNYINTYVSPYNSKGTNSTTNANDHVYTPETEGETEITLVGDYTNGFTSTFYINLPITA